MFLSIPKKPTPSEGNIPHEPAMALFRLLGSRHMQNVFGTRRFSGLIFDSPDHIQIHGQEIFSVTPTFRMEIGPRLLRSCGLFGTLGTN